ncbi:Hypothetical protein HVR_LOCUS823 [uncultured virus]|nr:Hypothetical protein HVR_LOCUS823 [uncultured virus]
MSQQIKNNQQSRRPRANRKKPSEIILDLAEHNVGCLSEVIRKCATDGITLKTYSSLTLLHPDKSMTEIPGLRNLFSQACIQHGLLGYLDWYVSQEKNPHRDHVQIILDNVIIITCGSVIYNPVTDNIDNSDKDEALPLMKNSIVHSIDEKRLAFIRIISSARFLEIMK